MDSDAGSLSTAYEAANQGIHIVAATWVMVSLATLVVTGRFYIRYLMIKRGGADDWWMLAGLAFLVTLAGLITAIADLGGFKHENVLSATTDVAVRKLFWGAQPVALVGSLLPKISIGLQLLFILPTNSTFAWQRYSIWFCLGTVSVLNLLVFIFVFAQCSPSSTLWTASNPYSSGQCWSPDVDTVYFTFTALWNALVDLVFALIPINIILNLRISLLNKALLLNFLGARLFAFIASVTKAAYIAKNGFAPRDLTWHAFDILLWTVAEQFCLCFCGSVPTYKAVFDRWLQKRASLKATSSYGGSTAALGVGTGSQTSAITARGSKGSWFYERKRFEHGLESAITVTTVIQVEHERLDSTDAVHLQGQPPRTPKNEGSTVIEEV